jgi:hypothetical protein
MRKLIACTALAVGLAFSVGVASGKPGPVAAASAQKQAQAKECPPRESARARSAACDKNHSNARFCRDEPDNLVGQCKPDT